MPHTLAEYVAFLRENTFSREADFYENTIPTLLSYRGKYFKADVLKMDVNKVMELLQKLKIDLDAELRKTPNKDVGWDVAIG
jgi:hypothetical protein